MTYIPTGEGWLYLAAIMDLHTRKVVGWAMRDHLRAELATSALTMAIQRRSPGAGAGLVHHSDRGVQGGFEWSSQHLDGWGCDRQTEAAVGPGGSGRVALAGAALSAFADIPPGDRLRRWGDAARRPAAVLGGDRGGSVERGRGGRSGGAACAGDAMVPGDGQEAAEVACTVGEAALRAASGVR